MNPQFSIVHSALNGRPALAASLLGACLAFANTSLMAGVCQGDDFNDNLKDTDRWGTDINTVTGSTSALLETNGMLQFVGTNAVLRPWTCGYGSYVGDWEAVVDVHLGQIPLTQKGSHVQVMLAAFNPDNPVLQFGLPGDSFSVALDLYLGSSGQAERSFEDYFRTNWVEVEPRGDVITTAEYASLRISFSAQTKTLTTWYDADGGANGYAWIPIRSMRIDGLGYDWGMGEFSFFNVVIGVGCSGYMVTANDFVCLEDFLVSGAFIPTVTVGKDTSLTTCNYTNAFFADDPNNPLPWPEPRAVSAQGNSAYCSLAGSPGHAGIAEGLCGLRWAWNLDQWHDDTLNDWPVTLAVEFSYSLEAFWTPWTGSADASVGLPGLTNNWVDRVGYDSSDPGTRSNTCTFLYNTTVRGLKGLGDQVLLQAYCHAHSAEGALATNRSLASFTLNSLGIKFKPVVWIQSANPTADNAFALTLAGSSGVTNVIQSSTNLVNWTNLATLFNTNGVVPWVDSSASNCWQKYYRALIP